MFDIHFLLGKKNIYYYIYYIIHKSRLYTRRVTKFQVTARCNVGHVEVITSKPVKLQQKYYLLFVVRNQLTVIFLHTLKF